MRGYGLAFLALFCTSSAQAFEMGMPVDCAMGMDCTVQNYVDHDGGDFACGPLTYPGHKGTDIRAVDETVMRRGVDVLATADGTVLGMRDGMADRRNRESDGVEGVECGNAVRLAHPGGWVTQYCHMKQGSVLVRNGEAVSKGQKLGEIGMSGAAAFPHVHVVVEKDGETLDPYTGGAKGETCGEDILQPLWDAEAAQKLAYVPTGLLNAGFTTDEPAPEEFQQGKHRMARISGQPPLLVFWADMYGLRKDDDVYIALRDPQETVMAESRQRIPRNRATQSYYVGKANREQAWPMGEYSGILRVERNGETVLEREFTVGVEP